PEAHRRDAQKRSDASRARRRVQPVDRRDRRPDRQTDEQPAPQGAADQEQRHRPELQGHEKTKTESNEHRMHNGEVSRTTALSGGKALRTYAARTRRFSARARVWKRGAAALQEMVIYGVSFDMVGKQPIVLLKTVDSNKFLPIWIGHPEAAAILMKLQGASTPRPMTHDLLSDLLEQLDAKCERVSVTELRDNTFYASITVSVNGTEMEIDSRPSDALALAVRVSAPIFAD